MIVFFFESESSDDDLMRLSLVSQESCISVE